MSKVEELFTAVSNGKSKLVPNLVQECLDEGNAPIDILNKGMIDAMGEVGEKFKHNEIGYGFQFTHIRRNSFNRL